MPASSNVIPLQDRSLVRKEEKTVETGSGRTIRICSNRGADEIIILQNDGTKAVKLTITSDCVTLDLGQADLALTAPETITFDAKKIQLRAEEELLLTSAGKVAIDTRDRIDVHADDDIKVTGRIIHLN